MASPSSPSPVRKGGNIPAKVPRSSGIADSTLLRSAEFVNLSAIMLPHWLSTVLSISMGRCVATQRPIPYLRPSFAIFDIVLCAADLPPSGRNTWASSKIMRSG